MQELLTLGQQEAIASISTLINRDRHEIVYKQGEDASFVFNIVAGAAQTYHVFENGVRKVSAFIFARDLFGLCENGKYVATAQALTSLTMFQIPIEALRQILERVPGLEVGLLTKLCSDLRGAQSHAMMIGGSEAPARVAGFLLWLQRSQTSIGVPASPLHLPMKRRDIADYLGLSHESVSRVLLLLESEGATRRIDARHILIVDQKKLNQLAYPT